MFQLKTSYLPCHLQQVSLYLILLVIDRCPFTVLHVLIYLYNHTLISDNN